MMFLSRRKNFDNFDAMWIRLDTIPQCDGQTDIPYQYHERICWCLKKIS